MTVSWLPRLRQASWLCLAAIASLLLLIPGPVQAQAIADAELPGRAPIVLDGRELFEVGDLAGFTATERAEFANQVLRDRVRRIPADIPIKVSQLERGALITLRIAGRHLLTITDQDLMGGIAAVEQADIWASKLQAAIERARYERTRAYYQQISWRILCGLLGAGTLYWLLRRSQRQLRRYRTRTADWRWFWAEISLLLALWGLWLGFALWLTNLFPSVRTLRYQVLEFSRRSLTATIVTFGDRGYSILELGKILALIFGLWLAVRALTSLIRLRLLQAVGAGREAQDAIALLIQISLTTLGLLMLLQALGVDVSSLAIFASVIGVGIGFGLQNIVNNFISGIIILLERPVRVGDFIQLGEFTGTVERIGIRSTEISTLDRISIVVPNSEFIDSEVINWSHGYPVSRLHIPLGVAYGSPIQQVRQAAIEAAKHHPRVLRYPRPQLWFQGFGDSSLDFDLLVWIREPRLQARIKSDLYYLLEANLRRYQIEIPFPQRDLNLRPEVVSALTQPFVPNGSEPAAVMAAPAIAGDRNPPPQLSEVMNWCEVIGLHDEPTEDEIAELVTQMRGSSGVERRDRRFGLQVYRDCFVGSEAVQWFLNNQLASREEAIRLGQTLVERGIVHHVTDEHPFKDEYLFYRFFVDEEITR